MEKMQRNHKRSLFKNYRNCPPPELEVCHGQGRCGGYTYNPKHPFDFQMCFIRSTLAYLCPDMINFNVVHGFSDRRSEEVISFF